MDAIRGLLFISFHTYVESRCNISADPQASRNPPFLPLASEASEASG